jgi:Tfp pilus tip-associated adhesin PilY1
MTGKRGWYIDLTASPAVGERIVSRAQVITLAAPVLKVSSLYPITNDECVPGGDGYLNYVDPFTGGGIQTGFIDVNKDGKFDGNDSLSGKAVGSVRLGIGIPTTSIFVSSGNGSASSGGSGGTLALTPNGKGEPERLCDGNGCPPDLDPVAKCSSGGLDIQNASDGTASLAIKGCPSNFKGRVSWREILKD